jgi:putative ABC transport system permease protein
MNGTLLRHAVFARLTRYRGKTALMILGIAIGVLAMVGITIFSEGAIRSFARYARIVYPVDSVVVAGDEGGELTFADVDALRAAIPEIVDWDPLVRAGGRVLKNEDRDVRVGVQGYSERAAQVRRRGVQEGEFFTAADVAARSRVALLGTTTVEELFGTTSPVGAEIFIDNLRFAVRGVLESAGADLHGGDLDQAVWIPYTTALDLVKSDSITSALLQLGDPALTEGVGERVTGTLRERHAIPPGYVDDFTLITPRGIGDQVSGMSAMIERFIAVAVTTVFAVAALIVVAVMLATVKQRSAEIGLRRALGARRSDLRLQIVLEVLVLSVVASALGLAAAWILLDAFGPRLFDDLGVQVAGPSASLALASVAAAVATGLVGAVPAALKAARLDPVEALR